MKNQMYIFGKTIFAAKKMRYVEVFAVLSGGPCSRGNCMIPKKFQRYQMRSCCLI